MRSSFRHGLLLAVTVASTSLAHAQTSDAADALGDPASEVPAPPADAAMPAVPDAYASPFVSPPPAAVAAPIAPPIAPPVGDGAVWAEVLGGVAGYAAGALLGGLILLGAAQTEDFGIILLGLTAGIFVAGGGLALGVDYGGDATGGTGSFWWTMLGQALGGVASFILFVATLEDSGTGGDDAGAIGLLGIVVLPVAGGVIGYELTDGDVEDAPAVRVGLAPSLDGRGGGATLGVRF